jgi:predicted secreted Zn-dependent protease
MKYFNVIIMIVLVIVGLSSSALSDPAVDAKKNYYMVSGRTADEIRSSLNSKTPVHKGGKNFDAKTDWFVKWNYRWNDSGDSCVITNVTTRVDIHYILPKLRSIDDISGSLRIKWEDYWRALWLHEKGHGDFGLRAARKIEKSLINLEARSSCKKLGQDANLLANQIIEKIARLEKEYDINTNHGLDDGAVFP